MQRLKHFLSGPILVIGGFILFSLVWGSLIGPIRGFEGAIVAGLVAFGFFLGIVLLAGRGIWLVLLLVLVILGLLLDRERSWGGIAWALLTAFVMYRIGLELAAPLLLPVEPHTGLRADIKSMVLRHAGGGKVAMAVIREGKVLPGPDGKSRDEARGEGILFIDSTSAVLLATDTRPTRVLEPGVHFMRKDEKIGAVVDLRIQMRRREDVEAQTRDGIPIKFTINARFRIEKTGLRLEEIDLDKVRWPAPYEWSPRQVVLALEQTRVGVDKEKDKSFHWDDIVLNEAVKRVHTLIAQYTFDELTEPRNPLVNRREEIRQRLEDEVRTAMTGKGIAVLSIGLSQFVPRDKQVTQQRFESWQAEWIRRRKVVEAEGEAESRRRLELARSQAQMDTMTRMIEALDASRQAGANNADLIALRFLEVLESLAKDPETQKTLDQVRRKLLGGEVSGGARAPS